MTKKNELEIPVGDEQEQQKRLRAYYLIGGITPVSELQRRFEVESGIKIDEYEAKEGQQSRLTLHRKVDGFEEAKTFIGAVNRFLWKTVYKKVEGGFDACGVEEDTPDGWEEYYDGEDRDFKEWEENLKEEVVT